MGLLDSLLYNSDNYGGQGGGLLDFLRSTQMQNGYQPSAGFVSDNNQPSPLDGAQYPAGPVGAPSSAPASFADRFAAMPGAPSQFSPSGRPFDSAQFDPATYAPNQAQPIAVGNYQMPRMGDAGQFQPSQAALPPNAQPAQGQLPPGQIAPQSQPSAPDQALPPALGGNSFGGNLGASLQSFANTPGGLIPKLVGGTSALFTGQRSDPQGIQQQNLKAQFDATRQALIANGIPESQASSTAMLAVMNPEAAKTVLPELLTNKEKYGIVSEDPLEGKKYGFINEREQTVNGKPLGAQGAGGQPQGLQNISDTISSKVAAGASRQELLQEVPSAYRGYVDAVLSGKALPANIGRSQVRGTIMTLAHSIDPTFDETMIPQRVKTAQDYAPSGKSGQAITAFNTVQHHIGKLSDDVENLDNGGWTILNSIRNGIRTSTPLNPPQQKAIQAVNDDIKAVTDEMSAAYKAGHVSDTEIAGWNKLVNSSLPPNQMHQALNDFVDLLNGKRDALNKQHQDIMGRDAPTIDKDENAAITQKVRARNAADTAGSTTPTIQEGATATNPKTGTKITFRNGKWQ